MSDGVRFLLNGEERTVADLPPTTTVLHYLRRQARLTGTKEGCAEGDCGACSVMISSLDGEGGLTHRTVNACIQFLPALDGCALTTVEHLAGEEGGLHPVQAALVASHGAQCGFCTPGFVVQLYGGWRNGELTDRQAVKDLIAGNLCRCTGYGPIIDAGLEAAKAPVPEPLLAREAKIADRLAALRRDAMLSYGHEGRQWLAPRSLDELAAAYEAHPDAVLVAGATDVGLWVTKQHRDLETLIDVTRIRELRVLEERDGRLAIGAAVTLRDAHAALARLHRDLGEMMRRFAGRQIRNAGTVGGNIANGSPIGDLPPALIALGATLHLRKGDARRALPLEDFFIAYGEQDRAPGEFVERVETPVLAPETRFGCFKLSKRFDSDISAVMGAFRLTMEGDRIVEARLAYGGMAATPKRARAAETALEGGAFEQAGVDAACEALADDFTPLSDMRASASYRLTAARNLLRRFHLETGGMAQTRVLEAAE